MVETALVFIIIFGIIASLIDLAGNYYASCFVSHAIRSSLRHAAVEMHLENNLQTLNNSIKSRIDANTSLNNLEISTFWETDQATSGGGPVNLQQVLHVKASGIYSYGFLRMFGIRGATVTRESSIRYEYQPVPGPLS